MDITATAAKQTFGEVVRTALRGERVTIMKRGEPALAVVTAARLDELERIEREYVERSDPWA